MQANRGITLSQRELKSLALGGLIGAMVGVAAAWVLITSPTRPRAGRKGKAQGFSITEALQLAVSFLRLVQKLAER